MKRFLIAGYGVVCYVIGFATLLYMIGFVGNLVVPRSIDSPGSGDLTTAIAVNLGLILLFGLQHSIMARPGFKQWWTRIVPEPAERSTYVLCSSLALAVLFWQWRPMGGLVWDLESTVARTVCYALFAAGWLTVLGSTFVINHFDLFGLRQIWLQWRGKPYSHLPFRTPGPYKHVRHPLYVGWILAAWSTPTMSIAHLIFAVGMTAYILIAIAYEERDLVAHFGESYRQYKQRVPMLIPSIFRSKRVPEVEPGAE